MDSAVAAHVSVRWGPCDILVYLDTGTGLDENREYVERYADELGVQLWTLRTHENYDERVLENGFPGPSRHGMYYNFLKERQIGKLATFSNGFGNPSELHFWTGVRSDESQRRMENVEPEGEGPRWTWHAPIHDWSKEDCREYLDTFDLPRNELWDTLGRSGDCFCGCFGSPEEKLDLRAAGCGYHADWLENLEMDVEIDGTEKEQEMWAWGALDEDEQKVARVERDDAQMTLCSTCGAGLPVVTDGGEPVDE